MPGRRQGGDGDASDSGSDSSSDTDADTAARQPRRVPLLVGPWDRVQVDPTAWGYGKKDLLTFAVKAASVRRIQLRALQRLSASRYMPTSGCRPKLWGPLPPSPGGPPPPTGLQVLEASWRLSFDTQPPASGQRGVRRSTAEFEVGLLPWQAPGRRARVGVWERVTARRAAEPATPPTAALAQVGDDTRDAAAPGPPGSAERFLWVELRRADLPRERMCWCTAYCTGAYTWVPFCTTSVSCPGTRRAAATRPVKVSSRPCRMPLLCAQRWALRQSGCVASLLLLPAAQHRLPLLRCCSWGVVAAGCRRRTLARCGCCCGCPSCMLCGDCGAAALSQVSLSRPWQCVLRRLPLS